MTMQPGRDGDAVTRDFDASTAAQLKQELADYHGRCHYDPALKKITYTTSSDALHAYMTLHRRALEEHRISERGKSFCINTEAELEWVMANAANISRFWRRTHVFVDVGGCGGFVQSETRKSLSVGITRDVLAT